MPSLHIQTVILNRACSVRLSPNIGGLTRPRPSRLEATVSRCIHDKAKWLCVIYNFSTALSEAKQLQKARSLSLCYQTAMPRSMRLALSRSALL